MKRLLYLLLAACLAVSLAACTGGGSEQLRTGRRLMNEYLSARGGGAVLTDSHTDVLRPDASHLVASDFVKGSFRAGGETYEIAANVVTGEIYTSERLAEFGVSCVRAIEERLGLDGGDCAGNCSVMELYAPAWREEKPEWPEQEAYLGHVLPVETRDIDAYAARALTDGNIRLIVYIACRNTELWPERWSESAVADWDGAEITLLALPEPDAALPRPEELTVGYRNDFAGDRLIISDGKIDFRPGAGREAPTDTPETPGMQPETRHKSPAEQIDVFLAQRDVWYQGGSPVYYPGYLAYAVTDLNQNGRLEILVSELHYDTNYNINRFFEIDEAETGVVEMDYDLADDEGVAPGLINADLPTLCFFGDGAYHYSLPTAGEPNENLEIEYFFILSMDQQGGVTTELLAEKWDDRMNDRVSYLRGLETIEQRDYDAADLIRYDGYDLCECTWEWVMLLEGWETENFRSELTDSWERFDFDVLGMYD